MGVRDRIIYTLIFCVMFSVIVSVVGLESDFRKVLSISLLTMICSTVAAWLLTRGGKAKGR